MIMTAVTLFCWKKKTGQKLALIIGVFPMIFPIYEKIVNRRKGQNI